MVIAYDKENIVAHMLVMLRRRGSLFPPYLFTQGRAYGEGEYSPDCNNKEEIFGEMLKSITRELRKALCLYIEFSDLSTKCLDTANSEIMAFPCSLDGNTQFAA